MHLYLRRGWIRTIRHRHSGVGGDDMLRWGVGVALGQLWWRCWVSRRRLRCELESSRRVRTLWVNVNALLGTYFVEIIEVKARKATL